MNKEIIDSKCLSWLHHIPEEKQYKDIRMKDVGLRNGLGYSKIEPVNYGRGFIIENESDPLFIEFKTKFPNVKYRIEE